jgi:hypothetical protein
MTVNGFVTDVADATELRKRLIRSAYALHFSAGQTATLFEQYSEVVPLPSEYDGQMSADRWRTLSDRALDIARACDRRAAGRGSADADLVDSCNGDASGHPHVPVLVDLATRYLSAAAMAVEAMLPFVEVADRHRLDDAVNAIDGTIRDLRT